MPSFLLLFSLAFLLMASDTQPPVQPVFGPGGAEYLHDSVRMSDFADRPDGYWLFEPESPRPDSAKVVVFNHGYGAYNPMIYGEWIRHLVRHGRIVIFPRYQRDLFTPSPKAFATNAATAIREALIELDSGDHVRPIVRDMGMVGHSYGGTISAYLAVHYPELDIPQPKALMLVAPGTGPFKGGRLEDYSAMPADTRLLIMVSEGDHVVGDELGLLIFETAVHTPSRNFIRQFGDTYGEPDLTAGHNQSYALYEPFDNGRHNLTYHRARRIASLDAIDFYGYWKLFDALLACTSQGAYCHYAFGNTPEQRSLGNWSDGTPVRALEVLTPP